MTERVSQVRWSGGPGSAAGWIPLLREGVEIEAEAGMSLRRLMEEVLGMAPDYVTERVLTVFLDASPLDDIETAMVRAGSVVALGAAMPGLAGIAMRRGSPIRAFRSGITACVGENAAGQGPVRVTVKLFNLVADEAGPALLCRGVLLPAERLRDYLDRRGVSLQKDGKNFTADGLPVSGQALCSTLGSRPRDMIRLLVDEAREAA